MLALLSRMEVGAGGCSSGLSFSYQSLSGFVVEGLQGGRVGAEALEVVFDLLGRDEG